MDTPKCPGCGDRKGYKITSPAFGLYMSRCNSCRKGFVGKSEIEAEWMFRNMVSPLIEGTPRLTDEQIARGYLAMLNVEKDDPPDGHTTPVVWVTDDGADVQAIAAFRHEVYGDQGDQ